MCLKKGWTSLRNSLDIVKSVSEGLGVDYMTCQGPFHPYFLLFYYYNLMDAGHPNLSGGFEKQRSEG